jgi:threonine dehydrogenase-like Zn-dependent dehydrogenase
MKTKRAYLIEPRKFELRETEVNPVNDQVLIKIAVCGLCNSELKNWRGLGGQYPQPLGHEWAGTVVELGPDVKKLKIGDRITALLKTPNVGYSEYLAVSESNCVKVAPQVDLQDALGEPLKCVLTVVRGAAPEAADHAVVQGCGPMGLWCIQALKGNYLSSLTAIDIDEKKLELAQKYGATHLINPQQEQVEKQIAAITDGHMADFVIEGTGVPELLNPTQRYLKKGRGRLVMMSFHEKSCPEFDFREAVARSLQIFVAHPAYSTNEMDDLRRAVSHLNKGTFEVGELVTHQFKLDEIQQAFETLEHKPAGYLKGIVTP